MFSFVYFFDGFVFIFVFLFFFGNSPTKVISCNFRVVFFFVSPRGLSLKCFFSFILFCFLVFLLSSLSNFRICFFGSCPSTPFWKILCFVSCVFFIAFALVHVCFFFSNQFPNIPILKPKLLPLLALIFIQLFFFCFDGVCFPSLCFYIGFVCVMFFV